MRIVEAVIAANDIRKRAMARRVAAAFGGSLRGMTVGILGLTFKPMTDDMRDAPSIPLITALHDMGALVRAFDPRIASRGMLPDKFPPMSGRASPNRVGGADGGTDQHGRAARGFVGGG